MGNISQFWSNPTSDLEAFRRASGRRHYNAIRKIRQRQRRVAIVNYMRLTGCGWYHGIGADLARRFGVTRKTICLDLHAIFEHNDFGGGTLNEVSRYRPENRDQ